MCVVLHEIVVTTHYTAPIVTYVMAEFGIHQDTGYNNPGYGAQAGYQQQYQSYSQPGYQTDPSASTAYPQQHSYTYQQQPLYAQQGFGNVEWYGGGVGTSGTAYDTSGNLGTISYNNRSTNFADEPPLLEELGIDVSAILLKTRAILLHRMKAHSLDDLDMGGALLFMCLLGGLHLLMGKWHMGVILGWSVLQSVVLWWLANQLAGGSQSTKTLDLYYTCCMVGYSMIPQLLLSSVALLLPRGPVVLAVAVLSTIWSGVTAAKLITRRSPSFADLFPVLAYPCILVFSSFAILSVY